MDERMTREQRIAYIIIHWIVPRMKREKLDWSQLPVTPAQVARLAELMD